MMFRIAARGVLLGSLTIAPFMAATGGTAVAATVQSQIESMKIEAVVTAIDKAQRTVTVKAANGNSRVIQAGPEVRNFDQIAVGDSVELRSQVAGMLDLKRPSGDTPTLLVEQVSARAPEGEKPGLFVEMKVSAVVSITRISADSGEITFVGPLGNAFSLVSDDEAFRKTMKDFRVGELVQAVYMEALSIIVLPKK